MDTDLDYQTLVSGLHPRTNQAIREVIRCLREMNMKLVKVIQECKDTPELPKLAHEFFDDSKKTLEFCSELKNCLENVERRCSGIIDALKLVDGSDVNRYVKTQQELQKIQDTGDPFSELKNVFQTLSDYPLGKLQTSKNRLDEELKTIQARRRASSIIITVILGFVLICSVVAAAKSKPPVAAGLAALGAIPLTSWIYYFWKKMEDAAKVQFAEVERMEKATHGGIKELYNIEVVIKRLENRIGHHLLTIQNVDCVVEELRVKIRIDQIKETMGVFLYYVNDWKVQADKCIKDLKLGETAVRQKLRTSNLSNP